MAFAKKIRRIIIAAALAVPMAVLPVAQAHAGIFISVGFAPPALPVYVQPVCPGDGYMWTPGYWAYDADGGYYWVPGVWVLPPQPGVLWTPPYWGFAGGVYGFHPGYWGPHVGFYGGINYGFGYGGLGFEGGYWNGGHFFYNTAVVRFGVGFHPAYVYSHPFVPMNHSTLAFNGPGGINARPSPQQMQAMHEQHFQPTPNQMSHQNFAAQDHAQFASVNHGRPGVPAAASVAAFHDHPNNPAAAARPTVNQREANQQQRIANGVRSGQMTSGEAARADQRQANIDSQVHNERTADGGRLNQQQRQQVNREQNHASKQINRENHNQHEDKHPN
jgi:hypothetical protein